MSTETKEDNAKKRKVNKGKKGVKLRYYKLVEYRKLNNTKINELRQWRKDNGLTKPKDNSDKRWNIRSQVIAAMREISKQTQENNEEDEIIK